MGFDSTGRYYTAPSCPWGFPRVEELSAEIGVMFKQDVVIPKCLGLYRDPMNIQGRVGVYLELWYEKAKAQKLIDDKGLTTTVDTAPFKA